ncbi:MAG: hypothetical protein ACI9VR_004297, partial [Cognaticolwellia sp.]
LIARNSRAEVVSITSDGFLCLKTGESELTFQSGEMEQGLLVKCQLVESLTVEPLALRVVLERDGEGGWASQTLPPPKVQVLNAEGRSMPELLSAPVVSNRKVVEIAPDGSLRTLGLGRSVLSYTAGGKSVDLVLDVGRLVDGNIRLAIPPGGRQIVPLKPGLQVADLSANTRIQAEMDGPSCGEARNGRSIEGLECEIGDRGSLVVENPGRNTARVRVKLVVFAESGS